MQINDFSAIVEKSYTGLSWNIINRVVKVLLSTIITIILVQYIKPEEYGELGAAMVFIGFTNALVSLGLDSAIIQLKKVSDEHLSSAFWVVMAFSIALSFSIYHLSPLISEFYTYIHIEDITRILSINTILLASSIFHFAILTKKLKFKQIFICNFFALIISGILAIILARMEYGTLALVYQFLSYTFLNTVCSWLFTNWRPSFIFNIDTIRDLYSFSFNLSGNVALNYWARNFDNLLIGKFLGSKDLGIYSKSYSFLLLPLSNISSVVSQVLFPTFSMIQKEHDLIRKMYIQATELIVFISFPLMVLLLLLSEVLVMLFFGSEWILMIDVIRIFSIVGIFQSFVAITGSLFLSQKRPDIVLKFSIVTKLVLFTSLYACVQFGVVATALCVALNSLIFGYFQLHLATQLIDLHAGRVLKHVFPYLALCIICGLSVHLLDLYIFYDLSYTARLFYIIFLFLFTYAFLAKKINLIPVQQLKLLIDIKRQKTNTFKHE